MSNPPWCRRQGKSWLGYGGLRTQSRRSQITVRARAGAGDGGVLFDTGLIDYPLGPGSIPGSSGCGVNRTRTRLVPPSSRWPVSCGSRLSDGQDRLVGSDPHMSRMGTVNLRSCGRSANRISLIRRTRPGESRRRTGENRPRTAQVDSALVNPQVICDA